MANLLKISLGIAKHLPTPLVSAFHAKVTKASSKYCGLLYCLYTLCQNGKIRKSAMGSRIWTRKKSSLANGRFGTALFLFLPLNRLIIIKFWTYILIIILYNYLVYKLYFIRPMFDHFFLIFLKYLKF